MKHNFKPYLNPVFIETGTFKGQGVRAALKDGFKRVISIEISNYYYSLCREKFKDNKNVELHFGDSVLLLPEILKDTNERCTFWLDGHYHEKITRAGILTEIEMIPVPLMEELKIIGKHHIKNHTLLLDDMRLVRNKDEWKDFPYCICDIEEMIHTINPKYDISYIDGYGKDDILVAQIK